MKVAVRSATEADVGAAVHALVGAFWTYSETLHLLRSERARRRALPRFLLADALDCLSFGTLDVAIAGGEIVGAAAWLPPEGYPIGSARQRSQLRTLLPAAPWAISPAIEGARARRAVRADHMTKPRHWFLRALGVRPDRQTSGVGSALVAFGVARADADGLGCYLTTASGDNVNWYRRFGFTVTAQLQPTPAWPAVWSLWREASLT